MGGYDLWQEVHDIEAKLGDLLESQISFWVSEHPYGVMVVGGGLGAVDIAVVLLIIGGEGKLSGLLRGVCELCGC